MALHNKKLFLLDMDGTIYLGNRLFDYTLPFIDYIKKMGARYMFLTNNSSKSAELYLEKLSNMQIPLAPEDLITSTFATARYLKAKYGHRPVYASGTAAFCRELATLGINITESMGDAVAIVMGYDTELTYQKLENMCILLNKGIDFIATNPDMTCPTEYGYAPDCGSVAQMLENATGRKPVYIGKPMPDMVYMALERAKTDKDTAIIIGDRLFTDIACGLAAGIDTALVLSGESTAEDIKTSPYQPKYIFKDLEEMLWMLKAST